MKIGGQRVEVISGAGPARGAEAPPVVGDHPVPGGQQGGLLLFPRVPVQRVPVHQHDRSTGPVILVVDPDRGRILPPDSDKRHRDPRRSVLAGVTPGPVITVAPDRHERYPWCDCTLRAAGMPGRRWLLSLGTALMYALAERTGTCQVPVNSPHSTPHPSLAARPCWPGCAGSWIRSPRL